MDEKHQTTVAWTDPAVLYAAHRQLTSVELFRAVRDGKVPLEPAMCLIGATLTKVAPGEIVMEMTPAEQPLDHTCVMQPGILAALTNTAAGYAVHTRVPLGVRCANLEVQGSLMEPVTIAPGPVKSV